MPEPRDIILSLNISGLNLSLINQTLPYVRNAISSLPQEARGGLERELSALPPSGLQRLVVGRGLFSAVQSALREHPSVQNNSNTSKSLARAFKNKLMKLSTSPLDRSSIDMFAGILRGSHE